MEMLNVNALTRVIQIRYNESLGSGFTVELNGKQFLVSAKHLFNGILSGTVTDILVYNEKKWKNLKVQIFFHKIEQIDIVVMKFLRNKKITIDFPIKMTTMGLLYGQEMFILGYPLGLKTESHSLDSGYPLPLIKKGIVSTIINENNICMLLLDVINNKGFSGGPVVSTKNNEMNFIGVISGYAPYHTPVLEKNADGSLKSSQYIVQENTGLAISYSIEHVKEIMNTIE